jgi:hypothetical protein
MGVSSANASDRSVLGVRPVHRLVAVEESAELDALPRDPPDAMVVVDEVQLEGRGLATVPRSRGHGRRRGAGIDLHAPR